MVSFARVCTVPSWRVHRWSFLGGLRDVDSLKTSPREFSHQGLFLCRTLIKPTIYKKQKSNLKGIMLWKTCFQCFPSHTEEMDFCFFPSTSHRLGLWAKPTRQKYQIQRFLRGAKINRPQAAPSNPTGAVVGPMCSFPMEKWWKVVIPGSLAHHEAAPSSYTSIFLLNMVISCNPPKV